MPTTDDPFMTTQGTTSDQGISPNQSATPTEQEPQKDFELNLGEEETSTISTEEPTNAESSLLNDDLFTSKEEPSSPDSANEVSLNFDESFFAPATAPVAEPSNEENPDIVSDQLLAEQPVQETEEPLATEPEQIVQEPEQTFSTEPEQTVSLEPEQPIEQPVEQLLQEATKVENADS
jgi:hypothetical protein